MGKINLIVALKEDNTVFKTAKTIALNSDRIRSIEAKTEDVNGTDTAGVRVMFDKAGDDAGWTKFFTSDVLATLKTAVAALTTTNLKSIDVTVMADEASAYRSGPNYTKNIPLDFFVQAEAHPLGAADSWLTMLAEDRKSYVNYKVDQTLAALVAAANA